MDTEQTREIGEYPPLTEQEIEQIKSERAVLEFWQEAKEARQEMIAKSLGEIAIY